MYYNVSESQNNYVAWKRLDEKEYVLYDLRRIQEKCKLIYCDRKQISGYLGVGKAFGGGWKERITNRQGNFGGCRIPSLLWLWWWFSWVHSYIQSYQVVCFKYLLYANYTSIKLLRRINNSFKIFIKSFETCHFPMAYIHETSWWPDTVI